MELDKNTVFAVAFLSFGMAALPFASAQMPPGEQPGNMTRFVGQDAIVLHDEAGQYMAIILDDNGNLLGTAGTVQSIDELEDQDLTVCLYEDNIDQDFIDIFQPGEGFFEGELFGDPLTDQERERVINTATCYQSPAEGGIF